MPEMQITIGDCKHERFGIVVRPMATLPDGRRLWGTPDGNVRIDGDGGVFCLGCGKTADMVGGIPTTGRS